MSLFKRKNIVKCRDCPVLIDKESAQCVKSTRQCYASDRYYCPEHTKPYDSFELSYWFGSGDVRVSYFKNQRVTEEGKIINNK